MALLFIGTSIAMQRQQYQDAVQSFASFLQGEYSAMVNVANDRVRNASAPSMSCSSHHRGQSDCFIVGRYIKSDGGQGRTYTSHPLYAKKSGGDWIYEYQNIPSEKTIYELDWGVRTKLSGSSIGPVNIFIVIYRDPDNGRLQIKTTNNPALVTTSGAPSAFSHFVKSNAGNAQRSICVYDTGWLNNERRKISLAEKAGSADAITIEPATGDCDD